MALAIPLDGNAANTVGGIDADDGAAHKLHATLARRFEHHRAELLRAEPASAPRMGDCDGFGGEIGKVAADETAVGDHIGAVNPYIEAARRRRHVRARWRVMKPRRAGAACLA